MERNFNGDNHRKKMKNALSQILPKATISKIPVHVDSNLKTRKSQTKISR